MMVVHMSNCRFFLCDDTAEYRALVRYVLEREGAKIVGEVGNGQECVERVADAHPDVVLLDVKMPIMGGIEALPKIREEAPDAQVIVLSTAWAERVESDSLRLGAKAFVEKPRDIHDLPGAIREALAA